jgi:flagellar hook assembly protein FlgD
VVVNVLRPSVNMFRPGKSPVQLYYGATASGKVRVTVYNALGRKIKTLVEKQVTAPFDETIEWDGKNASGSTVASGVYVIRIETKSYSKNIRVVVVK